MKTGLFIGRFQPFHNAHLKDIQDAVKEVDILYIIIGSSKKSNTKENPFSLEERKEMIMLVLKNNNINCTLLEVPDVNDDEKWVKNIEKLVPKADIIYTGNDWTERCFQKKRIQNKKNNPNRRY